MCGGGNLSKEHFWPDGLRHCCRSYPVNQHVEHSFTVSNKTRANPPHVRNKPGHAWTKKIRVVCETCNNGWMSALETTAKPLLTPLITGTPCVISEADGLTIARWIVLKVLVGEHNIRGDAVATQAQRDAFLRDAGDTGEFPYLGRALWRRWMADSLLAACIHVQHLAGISKPNIGSRTPIA